MKTLTLLALIVLSLSGCTASPESYHNVYIHRLSLEGGGG